MILPPVVVFGLLIPRVSAVLAAANCTLLAHNLLLFMREDLKDQSGQR